MIDKFGLYISEQDVTTTMSRNATGSSFIDQTITCVDCQRDFVWSADQQEFYREKNFSTPKRCKSCRDARKAERGQQRR